MSTTCGSPTPPEHSPTAIPDRFALDEIGKGLPDYTTDITSRL